MKSVTLVSLLLAFVMLLGSVTLFASCGEKEPAVGDTTDGSVVTTLPPETEPAETTVGPLEENATANFNNYTFKILFATRSTRAPNDFTFNDDGTVFDKSVYDRNAYLEEHGVVIEETRSVGDNHGGYETLAKMNSTNDPLYDFAVVHTYKMTPAATAGFLYDMTEVSTLDLEKPWWDQTFNDGVRIAGCIFYTTGDFSHAVDDYMYCVIFNKDMYEEKVTDGTDVYELVRQGTWTLDELARLASLVSEDVNADDKMDANDKYGLMTWCDELYASIQAAGERVAKVNDEGFIEFTLQNERVYNIVDKFSAMEQSDWCINFQTMAGTSFVNTFSEGRAMFFMSLFNEVSRFRNMETDYGILPNPRFDTNQKEWYCTFSAGLAAVSGMPFIQEDAERTGAILDLAGYYSSFTTSPAYYTKTLVGEKVRDEESAFCLDIIFDNKFVDIGHYHTIASLNSDMYSYVKDKKFGSFSSTVQTKARAANIAIKQLNKQIEKLKELYK